MIECQRCGIELDPDNARTPVEESKHWYGSYVCRHCFYEIKYMELGLPMPKKRKRKRKKIAA